MRKGRSAFLILILFLLAQLVACAAHTPPKTLKKGSAEQFERAIAGDSSLTTLPTPSESPATLQVDLSGSAAWLREISAREADDQIRDWALVAVLRSLGLTADDIAKATYTMSPLRRGYLEESFDFEKGSGRSAILANNTVVLLVDRGDQARTATLGRVADRARLRTGEIPDRFLVYSLTADIAGARLLIWQESPISGSEMFSGAMGYHEATVKGVDDLRAWLARVDDVTFAGLSHGGVVLGGRRAAMKRTLGVDVEDVAALYQAHTGIAMTIGAQRARENAIWSEMASELKSKNVEVSYRNGRPHSVRYEASMASRVHAIINRHLWRLRTIGPAASEPGFSLDPRWNLVEAERQFKQLSSDPCSYAKDAIRSGWGEAGRSEQARSAGRTEQTLLLFQIMQTEPEDLKKQCRTIVNRYGRQLARLASAFRNANRSSDSSREPALVGYWKLQERVSQNLEGKDSSEADSMLYLLLNIVSSRSLVQCARYDGPLQGTDVAMNLFYTDLLSKLWFLDDHRSAPVEQVPGFISLARYETDPTFEEERRRLPSTRVWFGPRADAFLTSDDGKKMFIGPTGVRVYAAGSNPLDPQAESQPAEASRRAIGFWDRHFQDVADYEPQYHRQNEIIKWSVLTGWLRQGGASLGLEKVTVDHSQRFDRWLETNRDALRYKVAVPFLAPANWQGGVECIPRLSTDLDSESWLEGGVSAGGDAFVRQIGRLSGSAEPPLRSGMAARSASGALEHSHARYVGNGSSVVDPAPTTRWRDAGAELELGKMDVIVKTDSSATRLSLVAEGGPVADLRISGSGREMKLELQRSQIEQARSHIARLRAARGSIDPDAPLGALADASNRSVTFIDGATVVVLPREGGKALRITTRGRVRDAVVRSVGHDGTEFAAQIVPVSAAEAEVSAASSARTIEIPTIDPAAEPSALISAGRRFSVHGNGNAALKAFQRAQTKLGDAVDSGLSFEVAVAKVQAGSVRQGMEGLVPLLEGTVKAASLQSSTRSSLAHLAHTLRTDSSTRSLGSVISAVAEGYTPGRGELVHEISPRGNVSFTYRPAVGKRSRISVDQAAKAEAAGAAVYWDAQLLGAGGAPGLKSRSLRFEEVAPAPEVDKVAFAEHTFLPASGAASGGGPGGPGPGPIRVILVHRCSDDDGDDDCSN